MHAADALAVLDDDPTGTQMVSGVPVLLRWTPERIAALVSGGARTMHLMTNTRALEPEQARRVVAEAAAAVREAIANPLVMLRGDSTLRGHVYEEYLGVRDAGLGGPVLLLVPALPHAGRITEGGVHFLERDGERVPLHETEYAGDGGFAYRDARLLQWAQDRSGGHFARERGREVAPGDVAAALLELSAAGEPAVCVPDVASTADLEATSVGLVEALAAGAGVVVRAGPAFAAVFGGRAATGLEPVPAAPRGLVVICGSHVPTTTRQLAALLDAHPDAHIEVDLAALASASAGAEIARAAEAAQASLASSRLAIVATPRARQELSLDAGARVATNLARVLDRLDPFPDVVIAKGGITSHITLLEGVGAETAEVAGPVAEGIALWRAQRPDGTAVAYAVFPGNVGDDTLLATLVDEILETPC